MVKGTLSPPQDLSFPPEEEPRMERGAEPWSWVLETSSAGSPDFYPGVGLRREAPPHVPPGSLFSLPWQEPMQSPYSTRQEKDLCVYPKEGSGVQPDSLSLPRLQKRPPVPQNLLSTHPLPSPHRSCPRSRYFHTRDEAFRLSQEPRPQRQEA